MRGSSHAARKGKGETGTSDSLNPPVGWSSWVLQVKPGLRLKSVDSCLNPLALSVSLGFSSPRVDGVKFGIALNGFKIIMKYFKEMCG